MSCTRKKDQLGLKELNPILSGSPRLVTHLNGHRRTQIQPNAANVCRHRCWWEHVHTHFQQREWPHAAQCNPAAAARCIPHYIPDFPSDIPAQCGGNLQCGGFTGLKKGEKVKGQSSYKFIMNKRGCGEWRWERNSHREILLPLQILGKQLKDNLTLRFLGKRFFQLKLLEHLWFDYGGGECHHSHHSKGNSIWFTSAQSMHTSVKTTT